MKDELQKILNQLVRFYGDLTISGEVRGELNDAIQSLERAIDKLPISQGQSQRGDPK